MDSDGHPALPLLPSVLSELSEWSELRFFETQKQEVTDGKRGQKSTFTKTFNFLFF